VALVLVSHDPRTGLAVADRSPGTQVVLLDGAAAAARATHPLADRIRQVLAGDTVVVVHDEAAVRRGIAAGDLVDGVKTVDLDEIADLVTDAPGAVMWL